MSDVDNCTALPLLPPLNTHAQILHLGQDELTPLHEIELSEVTFQNSREIP